MNSKNFQTPIKSVKGLGSAKSGTGHHIKQRVSAIALIFLLPWLLYSLVSLIGVSYDGALQWVGKIHNATLLILTFAAACYHMRLGMNVVIEDYIQKSGMRHALLIINTFLVVAVFVVATLSVVKIWISS